MRVSSSSFIVFWSSTAHLLPPGGRHSPLYNKQARLLCCPDPWQSHGFSFSNQWFLFSQIARTPQYNDAWKILVAKAGRFSSTFAPKPSFTELKHWLCLFACLILPLPTQLTPFCLLSSQWSFSDCWDFTLSPNYFSFDPENLEMLYH